MADDYYREALRLGQREYNACIAKGKSPFLPVLDDFLPSEKASAGADLGLVSVPAEFIVGTKTRGRVNAFAPNFMPLLEEDSEFAFKWKRLSEAHLTEGIRDPIKVYEYMNRYYVEEGNKRASVLKFFGALNIPAYVTRIMPEKTDDEDVEIYYEFVSFYKYSKINFIEFSKKGCYQELLKALGKENDELWTEDERREFSAVYYYFRQAYYRNGGDKLASTVGDAMLSYIKVYGYEELKDSETETIRKNLSKMWEDVRLQQDEAPIELRPNPPEDKRPGMFSWLFDVAAPLSVQVAFLYDGSPERSGWVNEHEDGRLHVQRVFNEKIQTTPYMNVMDGDPAEVIKQAINDGNKIIFTTSPRLFQASLRAAVERPDILIMNCSLNKPHRYIRTYYTRMYEAKFILGAIAGSLTESGKLGYVCDYPIFGQIAGINAFALGAQMTCPKAKVYLEWAGVKGANLAAQSLLDKGIQIISSHDTTRFLEDDRSTYGLSQIHADEAKLIANTVWKWGIYYEKILRRVLSGSFRDDYESSSKALNYYWGLSAGVVDIEYAEDLPRPLRRLGDILKNSIIRELCYPFPAPLKLQDGTTVGSGERLRLKDIVAMDYLVENVEGEIPRYEELSEMGKATVDASGVEPASEDV